MEYEAEVVTPEPVRPKEERERLHALIVEGVEAVAKGDATEAIAALIWANVEQALAAADTEEAP